METPAVELRVYSGRENGLMVIGTREALLELGAQLSAIHNMERAPGIPASWPLEVAAPLSEGPYLDMPDYRLSFHVKPECGLPVQLQKRRLGWPPFVVPVVLLCAAVGFLCIVRWVSAYAL